MRVRGLFAVLLLTGCITSRTVPVGYEVQMMNALTDAERAAGWRLLFDGLTTKGWRGYMKPDMPAGWQVVNAALTRVGGGGDIVTVDKYKNFELQLEWNISPGGNSGVFYRGVEGAEAIYYTAPEMQVLDDA